MNTEEIVYILALKQCKNIGIFNLRKLIQYFGTAKEVWNAYPKDLLSINGIGRQTICDIGNSELIKTAEKEILFCEKHCIHILCSKDANYPKYLSNCDDAPLILFYKGKIDNMWEPISIVGTRKMTNYGKSFIQNFLSDIAHNPIVTVSGLAIGTDSCVHEVSLENNIPTIAILAQSLNKIYPTSNKWLAEKILENNGALISEYAQFDGTSKEYFLQRNRLIAGFSQTLIVTETAFGGGSITTATYANQYNRDVLALPGKINDKNNQGCNLLISQNKAEIIVDIPSLIKNLNFHKLPELFPQESPKPPLPENPDYLYVLDCLSFETPFSLDEISLKIDFPQPKLLSILLELELFGFVKCYSGKRFLKI